MGLAPGQRLGPYEVVSALGAGGMGEVYRARDTRLLRDVAIKVLPESFADDRDRLARFEREAQVVAALNHPNIAAIYGLEQSGDAHVLVLELVEGETLAELIARGPLAIPEALAMATQIADALQAAHEKGIVHRDLKPANIALGPGGQVKILDFGLAKALDPAPAASTSGRPAATFSPTLSLAMTQAGMILGTAAYMSPEQAKGRAADKRADVWAFGCVLYEMLTGRRAFDSEDASETLAFVITKEPDWSLLPADAPEPLMRLLRRCLQKDPRERLHDIADARLDIKDALKPRPPAAVAAAAPSRLKTVAPWLAAALGVAAAVAIAIYALLRPVPDTSTTRFTFAPPAGQTITLNSAPTTATGAYPAPLAMSPDGRRVAFLANSPAGRSQIWIRALDALTAQPLQGTEGASGPFWSPDSRYVAFFANGRLRKVGIAGGPPVSLTEAADYRGGTWGSAGVIVFAASPTSGLAQVSDAGGVATPATVLAQGDPGHGRPSFLPDGRRFFYRVYNGGVYLGSLDSPDRTLIFQTPDASNVSYVAGHLVFVREATLMAQPFDLAAGALTGEPIPIADEVLLAGNPPMGLFGVSDTGVLTYMAGDSALTRRRLTWLAPGGTRGGTLGDPGDHADVHMSPDGSRTAVSLSSPQRGRDIWIFDNARGVGTKVTFGDGDEISPVWSPDGLQIAFASVRQEGGGLYVKPSSGVGSEELLYDDERNKIPLSWSSDGRYLLYLAGGGKTGNDLMVLPMSGERKPFEYLATAFGEQAGKISPDNDWVTYVSNESGVGEVYVAPFPKRTGKTRISTGGGATPRWSRDGRSIVYLSAATQQLMVADVAATGTAFRVDRVRELADITGLGGPRYTWDIAPDGRVLASLSQTQGAVSDITVVLNWTNLLRK